LTFVCSSDVQIRPCDASTDSSWRRIGREWFLKNGRIISFRNLDDPPWNTLCDPGTIECFAASEWAYSDDEQRQRDFVQLLNRSLNKRLVPIVRYAASKKPA
jgi:hypothetical protein